MLNEVRSCSHLSNTKDELITWPSFSVYKANQSMMIDSFSLRSQRNYSSQIFTHPDEAEVLPLAQMRDELQTISDPERYKPSRTFISRD